MIKVSELRLNNCVLHSGERTIIYQIERRYKTIYKVNDIQIDERIIGDTFQPIPITPELLEQCGFEKTIHKHPLVEYVDYRMGNFVLSPIGIPAEFIEVEYCALDIEERTYIGKFYFLHQLQNLIHVLTGNELTLKP